MSWRDLWLDFIVESDMHGGWYPYIWKMILEALALAAICTVIFSVGCAVAGANDMIQALAP